MARSGTSGRDEIETDGLHTARLEGVGPLNTKAVDRALQTQADRLCSLGQGPVVLPASRQNELVSLTVRQEG
jgi:hypothetical protein